MKVRVKFSKTGALRYIGHLDVMRYFQKAIRRSGLAAAYSRGFSPHMIMSFAEPLGVGLTSVGEYFDLELRYEDPYGEDLVDKDHAAPDAGPCPSEQGLLDALNAQMADDVRVLSVRRLVPGRKSNAMSLVAAASYTVSFPVPESFDVSGTLSSFLKQPVIETEKKTKSGVKTDDIRPLIFSLTEEEVPEDARDKAPKGFRMAAAGLFCASGSSSNLKPDAFMRAFCSFAGISPEPWEIFVRRRDLYAETEDGHYATLEELGDPIQNE